MRCSNGSGALFLRRGGIEGQRTRNGHLRNRRDRRRDRPPVPDPQRLRLCYGHLHRQGHHHLPSQQRILHLRVMRIERHHIGGEFIGCPEVQFRLSFGIGPQEGFKRQCRRKVAADGHLFGDFIGFRSHCGRFDLHEHIGRFHRHAPDHPIGTGAARITNQHDIVILRLRSRSRNG